MIDQKNAATTNQITETKPTVERWSGVIHGNFANSCNGGHDKFFYYAYVMAGQEIRSIRIKCNMKMLTPKTPTYQALKGCMDLYFCPDSRVFENSEEFYSQQGGATVSKVEEKPHIGGMQIPTIYYVNTSTSTTTYITYLLSDTTLWRDAYISTYIPRIGNRIAVTSTTTQPEIFNVLPKAEALRLRGSRAIYNDLLRNKEYDTEEIEYKGDTFTETEFNSYLPDLTNNVSGKNFRRCRKDNSYYTNYRTELQGFETTPPDETDVYNSLLNWTNYEAYAAEARSQANNAQKTPWDVMSELFGSVKLTEGKTQLLDRKTWTMNYSTVTQSTYNNSEEVDENFRVMGQQGAYSYTEIDIPLSRPIKFKEPGYLHFLVRFTANTVYENGFDRMDLNVKATDLYRPDMIDAKNDVLYEIEMGTGNISAVEDYEKVVGIKRRYNEILKLPNVIGGDLTTNNYYEYTGSVIQAPTEVETQKTFQFFENDPRIFKTASQTIEKKIWKDYTDIMINKNLAIPEEFYSSTNFVKIKGQNQIFFMGEIWMDTTLPINPDIADNYTQWGEH